MYLDRTVLKTKLHTLKDSSTFLSSQVATVATVTLVDEHEDHYCVCLEFDVTFV